ncbi:MAG TPA: hypothetical protein VMG08_06570 [Allosphingosinicella sp.]|nr:hypothetical protein [Allosphingosinicella sp.]
MQRTATAMKGKSEMACDRARNRALLLSLGLFGAPTGQAERGREARAVEAKARPEAEESNRSR